MDAALPTRFDAPVAGDAPAASRQRGTVTRAWGRLLDFLLSYRPLALPRLAGWERRALQAIFVLSAVVQLNADLHGGSKGQDYPGLYHLSEAMVLHPDEPWHFGAQDPPVFVLTNALLIALTHRVHSTEVIGLFNLLFNLGAMWTFYLLARRFVGSAPLRVALMTLVAFLPLRLIHTIVIAGDALVLWPFYGLALLLIALTDTAASTAHRRKVALGVTLVLTLGLQTKYTFMSSVVAVFLVLVQLVRRRRVPWREAVLLAGLSLALPVSTVVVQQRLHPDFSSAMDLKWSGDPAMSYRDVFWVHGRDMHIFRAPPYDEPLEVERRGSNGKPVVPEPDYELLTAHQYSFLALNHLGIFTDIMNIFQVDPTDNYFGQRNARNQRLMALAVRTALPITLATVAVTALLSTLLIAVGVFQPGRSRADLEAVFLLAFGWFSNIIVFLPCVPAAYVGGFWMPRLTLPALLVFLLFVFYLFDRLPPGRVRTAASWLALVYVGLQSALQVCFLWPWGQYY